MALVYAPTFACFLNHHPILKSAPSEAFSSDSTQLKPYLFSLLESSNMVPKNSPRKNPKKETWHQSATGRILKSWFSLKVSVGSSPFPVIISSDHQDFYNFRLDFIDSGDPTVILSWFLQIPSASDFLGLMHTRSTAFFLRCCCPLAISMSSYHPHFLHSL